MRRIILMLLGVLTIKYSSGQITKNNWLVGGTGLFNSIIYKNDLGLQSQRITNIQLAPNIGYFFEDKFAGGLKLSFATSRNKNISDGTGYNLGKIHLTGLDHF